MPRSYEGVQSTLAAPMRDVATVGEALGVAAERWPDRPYLTYAETGETASFADVNGRVSDVAAALADVGVEAGDRVGLYLTNGPARLWWPGARGPTWPGAHPGCRARAGPAQRPGTT